MSNRRNLLALAALAIPAAGCSALSTPVQPSTDVSVITAYNIAQGALVVLSFVPGLPAIVLTEAKTLLDSLQVAYLSYKNAPPGSTVAQAALQAAIDAASNFLTNNGLPAAMATPSGRKASVKLVR